MRQLVEDQVKDLSDSGLLVLMSAVEHLVQLEGWDKRKGAPLLHWANQVLWLGTVVYSVVQCMSVSKCLSVSLSVGGDVGGGASRATGGVGQAQGGSPASLG